MPSNALGFDVNGLKTLIESGLREGAVVAIPFKYKQTRNDVCEQDGRAAVVFRAKKNISLFGELGIVAL